MPLCAAPDHAETTARCHECGQAICPTCQVGLGENFYCATCVERAHADLRSAVGAVTSDPNYGGAAAFGLAAALVGSLVWGCFTFSTGIRLGLIAIGIGYVVGMAVVRGAGNKRGQGLQALSVLLTVIGVLGGLFLEAHFTVGKLLATHGAGDKASLILTWHILPRYLQHGISPMTWMIVALGVYQGWVVPRAPRLKV